MKSQSTAEVTCIVRLASPVRKGDRLKAQQDAKEKIRLEREAIDAEERRERQREALAAKRKAEAEYIDPVLGKEAEEFADAIISGVEESLARGLTSKAIELVVAFREHCDPHDPHFNAYAAQAHRIDEVETQIVLSFDRRVSTQVAKSLAEGHSTGASRAINEARKDAGDWKGRVGLERRKLVESLSAEVAEAAAFEESRIGPANKAILTDLNEDCLEGNTLDIDVGADGDELRAETLRRVASGLKRSRRTRVLQMYDNQVTDVDTKLLSLALAVNQSVTAVHLGSNHIAADGAENVIGTQGALALAQTLIGAECQIATLDVRWNHLGDAGAQHLAQALRGAPRLTRLDISGNGIGDMGAIALAAGLRAGGGGLTSMALSFNRLAADGARALGSSLKTSPLRVLELDHNLLKGEGVRALAEGLVEHPSRRLAELHLSQVLEKVAVPDYGAQLEELGKTTSDDGACSDAELAAKALSRYLAHRNCTLRRLVLSKNKLGDEGIAELAVAVRDGRSLFSLELDSNGVGDKGARALGMVLAYNRTLEKLDLRHNNIRDDGAASIGAALKQNQDLEVLVLKNNQIGLAGTQELANGLMQNTGLLSLSLGNNKGGDGGAQGLVKALQQNVTLTELDFENNSASGHLEEALEALLDEDAIFERHEAAEAKEAEKEKCRALEEEHAK